MFCSWPSAGGVGDEGKGGGGAEEKPEPSPSCSEVHTVFVLFSLPWRCDPAGRLGPSWGRWPPPALRWNCSAPGRPAWSRWCATALPHAPQCSPSPGCTSPARKWTETKPFSFHLNPVQTENIPSPIKKSISHLSCTTQYPPPLHFWRGGSIQRQLWLQWRSWESWWLYTEDATRT